MEDKHYLFTFSLQCFRQISIELFFQESMLLAFSNSVEILNVKIEQDH